MADTLATKLASLRAAAQSQLDAGLECQREMARAVLLLMPVVELTADFCCCDGEDTRRTPACLDAIHAIDRGLPGPKGEW